MKRLRLFFLLLLGCSNASLLFGLGLPPVRQPGDSLPLGLDVAVKWANLSLYTIQNSPHNSPTYSSRSLAYLGLTMYESVVHSSPNHRSLAGQINGLKELPAPQPNQAYNWPLVLNAGQAFMLYKLYPHADRNVSSRIDSLYMALSATLSAVEKPEVVERSVTYGWAIATAIFDWSKTDGGYEGYSRNFDVNYQLPTGKSYWVAPIRGQSRTRMPLHPTWGSNRTFVLANQQLPVPGILAYSADPNSEYYKEFKAVYTKNGQLTEEEKAIAIWWADDPSHTAAPPGHSYNIATTVIQKVKPDLVKAAETYARVGMAVADAFINCWKCKYKYHRERPSTFIADVIEKDWKPFWPEPPFPAYSSGHSTQAAAMATVLTELYGKRFELTDATHQGLPPDPATGTQFKSRHFRSFWEMAIECANSRFYGGIHTNYDNKVGLTEGTKIGSNVNALAWRK